MDKSGDTIDFLLTAKRDKKAARRYLKKAIGQNGSPSLINIDKSGSNKAAIKQVDNEADSTIEIRQCKYLNNIIEQDHRFIKKLTRPMMGFKNFSCCSAHIKGDIINANAEKRADEMAVSTRSNTQ